MNRNAGNYAIRLYFLLRLLRYDVFSKSGFQKKLAVDNGQLTMFLVEN